MAGNDAEGKQPTVAEEMAKFQGFAVKDGETDSGAPTAEEQAAAAANSSTHAENVARAAGKPAAAPAAKAKDEKPAEKPAEKESKGDELSVEEENAAIEAAAKKAGISVDDMDEAAKDKAVADAVTAKGKAAEVAARRKTASARIADITRARRTAERANAQKDEEIAQLRRDVEALKAGKPAASLTADAKGAKTELPGKPDHTDAEKYEYGKLDPDYLADLSAWAARNAIHQDKEASKSGANSEAEAEAKAAFDAKVTEFDEAGLALYEDFDAVVIESRALDKDDPAYWPLSPTMGELLLESEHGPAIAYELASNPKEARRLCVLSPAAQTKWFVRKEDELSAGSGASQQDDGKGDPAAAARQPAKKPAAQESKAPVPLRSARKLNGSGGNQVPNSATPDFAAFEAQAMGQQRN